MLWKLDRNTVPAGCWLQEDGWPWQFLINYCFLANEWGHELIYVVSVDKISWLLYFRARMLNNEKLDYSHSPSQLHPPIWSVKNIFSSYRPKTYRFFSAHIQNTANKSPHPPVLFQLKRFVGAKRAGEEREFERKKSRNGGFTVQISTSVSYLLKEKLAKHIMVLASVLYTSVYPTPRKKIEQILHVTHVTAEASHVSEFLKGNDNRWERLKRSCVKSSSKSSN